MSVCVCVWGSGSGSNGPSFPARLRGCSPYCIRGRVGVAGFHLLNLPGCTRLRKDGPVVRRLYGSDETVADWIKGDNRSANVFFFCAPRTWCRVMETFLQPSLPIHPSLHFFLFLLFFFAFSLSKKGLTSPHLIAFLKAFL